MGQFSVKISGLPGSHLSGNQHTRSRALERGLERGVYNGRGVTVRSPFDGGDHERSLAGRYRRDAEALRFDWVRTAACLDRIADTYERDAGREDRDADLRGR